MAKINLLTVHWGGSYGGTMQTYATLMILKELGHKVTLIDLNHPNQKFFYKLTHKRSTKLLWIINEVTFALFRLFHLGKKTRRMFSIENNTVPESDYTIVGSDQVWNGDITGPIQMSYFLNFEKNAKKLSFASSFGKFQWEENETITNEVKSNLKQFSAISVREESGVRICKEVFDVDAVQVLDPTLVYKNYDELLTKQQPIHQIYPFLLNPSAETNQICQVVSREIGLQLYNPSRIKGLLSGGPKAWLNRMKASDFIITDSFHGLAFSLIFHKQFIVLCANEKKFARLESLLSLVNLSDRYVKSSRDLLARIDLLHRSIDFDEVDRILALERKKSIAFLTQNIQ